MKHAKKLPSLEKEIARLPRMKWFKLITKDMDFDNETVYSKYPLLTKQYCITVLKPSDGLLENVQASPIIVYLWAKHLLVTEKLFLGCSRTVKEKRIEIVEDATTYCKAYKCNFSRSFVYLRILENHLNSLILRFDLPSLHISPQAFLNSRL